MSVSGVHGDIVVGSVLTWSTSYTDEEVARCCALAGRPTDPLPDYLPYLLVVAPLTKLGGDLNYLSGRMTWTAARPVRRNETLSAELAVTRLDTVDGVTRIAFDARIRASGDLVIEGHSRGVVGPV
ncbi:hypothetical protein F0L68_34245 [Solihabitans fulvus]|uniref:MaoC like domain-containing protein n=1 Tax=Solihabitans fulvus TaxID=1892852 RepID=A0A5B2WSA0_9PSEU|nr:hypothetical protein [Solihabitans fulvus]KAA2252827.1 hypothetical protein F0L68_34245 [Solihabitans fulvus]